MQIFWDNFNLKNVLRKPDEITRTVFLLQLRNLTVYRCSDNSLVNCNSLICISEAATRGVLCKEVFLKISQNSQENTCARVSFLIKLQASGLQLYQKETLAQGFSCESCEISIDTFFTEHLWMTASSISIAGWMTDLNQYLK